MKEKWLSEQLLQKLLDKGLDPKQIRTNPMRMTIKEARNWLYANGFVLDVGYCTDGQKHYYVEIYRIRLEEKAGATLNLGVKYDTPEEAYIAGIEYCVDKLIKL